MEFLYTSTIFYHLYYDRSVPLWSFFLSRHHIDDFLFYFRQLNKTPALVQPLRRRYYKFFDAIWTLDWTGMTSILYHLIWIKKHWNSLFGPQGFKLTSSSFPSHTFLFSHPSTAERLHFPAKWKLMPTLILLALYLYLPYSHPSPSSPFSNFNP